MWIAGHPSPRYNLFWQSWPSLHHTQPARLFSNVYILPSVAVVQCKMRGWFVVMVLIVTLVFQGTAQLSCKLWGPLLLQLRLSGIVHICLTRKEQAPLHPRNSCLIPPTNTRTHTYTHTQHVYSWSGVSPQPLSSHWRRNTSGPLVSS